MVDGYTAVYSVDDGQEAGQDIVVGGFAGVAGWIGLIVLIVITTWFIARAKYLTKSF